MTKWFGKSWGAPCCDPDDHTDTPVDALCLYCDKPILASDQGVMMPLVSFDKAVEIRAAHYDCFIATVLPHTFSCAHCRGRSREQHKMSCSYRKHGGDCCCFTTWKSSPAEAS